MGGGGVASAQHCAPIVESYLSAISVRHEGERIRFHVEYRKNGGLPKAGYQGYLLAYLDRDAGKIPGGRPGDVIDENLVVILHTGRIERKPDGAYALDFEIASDDLAKRMIAHGKLGEGDRDLNGGWGSYRDRIRLAVFIPFLEDQKYSKAADLPRDKHECNYRNDRALLWQPLPYALGIHFGIVQAVELPPGRHAIQIQSDVGVGNGVEKSGSRSSGDRGDGD
jgi:hypothetical protein